LSLRIEIKTAVLLKTGEKSSSAQTQVLVSVSAADAPVPQQHSPNDLAGVPVIHFSGAGLQAMVRRA